MGAALLWLNGCAMLGPDFETPDSKSPASWLEEDNTLFLKPTEDHTIGWWSTFNDPTLDRLIELFAVWDGLVLGPFPAQGRTIGDSSSRRPPISRWSLIGPVSKPS